MSLLKHVIFAGDIIIATCDMVTRITIPVAELLKNGCR